MNCQLHGMQDAPERCQRLGEEEGKEEAKGSESEEATSEQITQNYNSVSQVALRYLWRKYPCHLILLRNVEHTFNNLRVAILLEISLWRLRDLRGSSCCNLWSFSKK